MPGDERHVHDGVERREAAVHRQPPRRVSLTIGRADRRQQVRRAGEMRRIAFVDPIPGEVGEDDRRDARGCCGRAGERRRIGDRPGARRARRRSSASSTRTAVEASGRTRRRAGWSADSSRRRLSICTTPVSHSPAMSVIGTRAVRSKSQRGAEVRTTMVEIGPPRAERVDDLDLPGRVSEAVTGDVEEDGRHERCRSDVCVPRPGWRPRALLRACARDGTSCPSGRPRAARSGPVRSSRAG